MSSRKRGVVYTLAASNFRNTLNPQERELFNECIARIYVDPRVDRKYKFAAVLRPPLVDYFYRNDNFIIFYQWEQLTDPVLAYRVVIHQALWTKDIDTYR